MHDNERLAPEPLDLGRLAHELRTPLAAIQSMADALAGGHLGTVGDPRHQSYLVNIRETAQHALAVIDGMMADGGRSAALAHEAPGPVDLGAIAHEVAASLALLAEHAGVRLQVVAENQGASRALARPTEVRQMLINLVSNGITHAGRGASVQIRTDAPRDDGLVAIEIVDDGPGIAEGVLAVLASGRELADTTAAAPRRRLRLGLAVTRALAIANGGRLDLETGRAGTRALLLLPAA